MLRQDCGLAAGFVSTSHPSKWLATRCHMLQTGVVYDLDAIISWFDRGHNTCPATGLPVRNKQLVARHDLQRQIEAWAGGARGAALPLQPSSAGGSESPPGAQHTKPARSEVAQQSSGSSVGQAETASAAASVAGDGEKPPRRGRRVTFDPATAGLLDSGEEVGAAAAGPSSGRNLPAPAVLDERSRVLSQVGRKWGLTGNSLYHNRQGPYVALQAALFVE